MATTRLEDIISPEVYQDIAAEQSVKSTAFFQSGVAVNTPLLNQFANASTREVSLPFWKPLNADDAPNLSNDNPADIATPSKVLQAKQKAYKTFLNKGYSSTDLASELSAGDDALRHVVNTVEKYWADQWQYRTIATLVGLAAQNAALPVQDQDMIHNAASESIAGQSASTMFNFDNVIDAAYTIGDRVDAIQAIAVHSRVAKQIAKDVELVIPADGSLSYSTYMGRRLIVDDGLPVIAGATDGVKYLSVLFGAGAVGYGEGQAEVPVAVTRDEDKGNGGGMETLWTRKTWLLHPYGYKAVAEPAGISHSIAELEAAATWERVVDRKNVPLAFLFTN